MKCITLIGYMCVGKTTVGRDLARRLGLRFYDLDWYIEERYHTRVPEIFASHGESYFRDVERRMLHETAEFEDIVLACGGGTPCFFDNMDYLNQVSTTVYLHATPATILRHLKISRGHRPLLEGKSPEELQEFVEKQLGEREPFYSKAQIIEEIPPLDTRDKVSGIINDLIPKINTANQ